MGESLVTPIGRASFPHLDKQDNFNNYSMKLLLPKADPKVKDFISRLKAIVTREMLAACGEKGLNSGWANFTALKDGDDASAFKTHRPEHAGHWELSLRKKPEHGKPCVVNANKQPIDASEVYSGCDVIVFMDVYGYNFAGKKSVSFSLQHVMKVRENTPFSSAGTSVESAFADLDIQAEADQVVTPMQTESPFGGGVVEQVRANAVAAVAPTTVQAQPNNPFGGM